MAIVLAAWVLLLSTGQAGSLTFTKPAGWNDRAPASAMRVAEFVVPRAAADTEDGELIVYFFGGTGGSVADNLKRWEDQFESPKEVKHGFVSDTIKGLKITTIDVKGTYVAEVRPGAAERHNKPGFRMRAAVVETPKGPYFIKFTGPAATVAMASPAFEQFIAGLGFK
jgi:hypothetical protein